MSANPKQHQHQPNPTPNRMTTMDDENEKRELMTAHQFGRLLLAGPDLPVLVESRFIPRTYFPPGAEVDCRGRALVIRQEVGAEAVYPLSLPEPGAVAFGQPLGKRRPRIEPTVDPEPATCCVCGGALPDAPPYPDYDQCCGTACAAAVRRFVAGMDAAEERGAA